MGRYFVTSCLYNPSLYHIIVLCLHACGSLSTSPSGDESGFHLTNVVQYSPFPNATFAMTSEDQDDIHFVEDFTLPHIFHVDSMWSLDIFSLVVAQPNFCLESIWSPPGLQLDSSCSTWTTWTPHQDTGN